MPDLPEQIIRPEILTLPAYHVPDPGNMIKLDAMENPYPLPASLRDALSPLVANANINRYPDAGAVRLKARLREVLAVPDSMDIMTGNGSDEIIQIVAMATARPGAVLLSVEPAFVMFRMIATFAGLTYQGVPLRPDFSLDLEAMLAAIAQYRPAVIFIAYPNNPTGNLFDAGDICRIIEASSGLVVIDEAYHAFADASFMDKLNCYPNLLLMRTLSKLGLAGLRLGLLIGRAEWLMHLEKLRLPYNINVTTQIIADKVLQHGDVLWQQAAMIKAERTIMKQNLTKLKDIEVFPSDANFFLLRMHAAGDVFHALKQQGVLVKNLCNAHSLLKNCLRVTVGTPDENRQFLNALQTALSVTQP